VNQPLGERVFWKPWLWVHAIGYLTIWLGLLGVSLFVLPPLKAFVERVAIQFPNTNRLPGIGVLYAPSVTTLIAALLFLPGAWLIWCALRSHDDPRLSFTGFGLNVLIGALLLLILTGVLIYYAVLIPPALSVRPK
jgi:hypothetical protein